MSTASTGEPRVSERFRTNESLSESFVFLLFS